MRRVRFVVEYDGAGLSGFQRQANAPTVQGHLEDAALAIFGVPTPIAGASRTDAGVHARGQVAMLSTDHTMPARAIAHRFNHILMPQIAVRDAIDAAPDFHPRFSATGKWYRYLIFTRAEPAPRFRLRAWHRRGALDLAAMSTAAADLLGMHDFTSFRAVGCSSRSPIRFLESVTCTQPEPHLVQLDVRGNAFLRNMVRIVAGTLAEVGAGMRDARSMPAVLAARDRVQAGITAPAEGLELMEVRYDGVRLGP